MALEEKANENDLAFPTSAEQTEVCLEHQCSKSYLLSMLQDPPEQKLPISKPVNPDTSKKLVQVVQRPPQFHSVLMGLSGDGKHVLLLPSNLRPPIQASSSPVVQQATTSAATENKNIVRIKRPNDGPDSEKANKIHKDLVAAVLSMKKEKEMEMGPRCNCRLSVISKKFHCNDFTDEDRKSLFTDFWKNKDWEQRKELVCSLVKCGIPNARRRECLDPSRKEFAFQYNLKKNGEMLRVCKTMFLTTLSVGDGTVRDWVMSAMRKKPFVNL